MPVLIVEYLVRSHPKSLVICRPRILDFVTLPSDILLYTGGRISPEVYKIFFLIYDSTILDIGVRNWIVT